ncbi:hypothetical protein ACFO25_13550 [Paenactinomyces guangxiensis]|uniref:Uncharacterized protein n=1 Tax=Paenactinomyces guangxiensis TaxID=1490290 RepID=A0A7W1WP90_9BACL|nr:hypothetical protein [Paenactinomyces guangxiensis]MBA4493470.1 hypothetical protein [Paenactinomyces guangxiensis]MBH8590561.1 hypothetical protein [Paenactinomyces guangxiensis]
MFVYRFGPFFVKVIFPSGTVDLEKKAKRWYKHVLVDHVTTIDHVSYLSRWDLCPDLIPPTEDRILWQETKLELQSIFNINLWGSWNPDSFDANLQLQGGCRLDSHTHFKMWEFVQRISLYPKIVNSRAFMLHCVALLINGKVSLFMGPSGAGKSTIAEKAIESGYQVLTDDTALLMFDSQDQLTAWATPYPSKSGLIGLAGSFPVSRFYVLKHSPQVEIKPLPRNIFARSLLERIFETQYSSHVFGFKSKGLGKDVFQKIYHFANLVTKKYTAEQFGFSLDTTLKDIFE